MIITIDTKDVERILEDRMRNCYKKIEKNKSRGWHDVAMAFDHQILSDGTLIQRLGLLSDDKICEIYKKVEQEVE